MENKDELVVEATKKLMEIGEMDKTADSLKSNTYEFLGLGNTYKVHMPVAWEKDEINKARMKKYVEFLNDPLYLFRKQVIVLLKKKGVDIVAMEQETEQLYRMEKDLLKRLALATMKDDIDSLKAKVEEIREQAQEIFFEREDKLRYCIEKQLEDFVRFYLIYVVLEVKVGDTWEKKYKSYDDFQKADDDLIIGRAAQILASLVYNVKL
jgi:hypothetical protein